jgi:hypothetical protein
LGQTKGTEEALAYALLLGLRDMGDPGTTRIVEKVAVVECLSRGEVTGPGQSTTNLEQSVRIRGYV